eukprot:Nitzschia sp. Nitz4//scaffold442_size7113//5851//6585//NITZ4_009163-RA/size7113-processed-gene-0.5-mRNA-1//1//CDS//3329552032//6725//frame0
MASLASHTIPLKNYGLALATGILIGSFLTPCLARLQKSVLWNWVSSTLLATLGLDAIPRHASESQAFAIEQHIHSSQTPSVALGIRVHSFDEVNGNSLALEAPLVLNTNVHKTAFAGSLYSVGVLTSFYLARQWMIAQGISAKYTLVARSATIRYRRPVKTPWIVASSVLPKVDALASFRKNLETNGKAVLVVSGTVQQPDAKVPNNSLVACEMMSSTDF